MVQQVRLALTPHNGSAFAHPLIDFKVPALIFVKLCQPLPGNYALVTMIPASVSLHCLSTHCLRQVPWSETNWHWRECSKNYWSGNCKSPQQRHPRRSRTTSIMCQSTIRLRVCCPPHARTVQIPRDRSHYSS